MLVRRAELEAAVADQFDRVRDRLPDADDREPVFDSALRTALRGTRGGRLLDLGCGKGRFLSLWRQAGFDVVALDRSRGMLCGAQASAPPAARPGFVCASASDLPFADACFDAVSAVEVMEHLPDVEAALREMHRVLRPGGSLLLLDKNVASLDSHRPYVPVALVKWIDQRRGLWMYPSDFVFRERWFWVPGLVRRLRRSFSDVRADYVLSAAESQGGGGWLFRRIPQLRRFVLVTGRKPALN